MPRAAIAVQTPKGPYPGTIAANALDLAFTAANATDKNESVFSAERMLVLWHNTGAGARTVTINSVPDAKTKRSADVAAFSQGAGERGAFVVERDGWQQSDGKLYFEAEHAEVLFCVLALP